MLSAKSGFAYLHEPELALSFVIQQVAASVRELDRRRNDGPCRLARHGQSCLQRLRAVLFVFAGWAAIDVRQVQDRPRMVGAVALTVVLQAIVEEKHRAEIEARSCTNPSPTPTVQFRRPSILERRPTAA